MNKFRRFAPALVLGAALMVSTSAFAGNLTSKEIYQMNYKAHQLEDVIEKLMNTKSKVDWDIDLVYYDGKLAVVIEYDNAKAFNKLTEDQIKTMLTSVMEQITPIFGDTISIEGAIVQDDATAPTYTFIYKDGKLDLKQ